MKRNAIAPWSRRLTALLLVLFMVVSMIPMTALATEPGPDPPAAEAESPQEAEPPPKPEPEPQPEPQPEPEPEPQPEPEPEPEEVQEEQTARQDAAMAGATDAFGIVSLYFGDWIDDNKRVTLGGYQFITECSVNATPQTVVDESQRQAFITTGNYVAYFCGRKLYLKGNLNGACIDLQHVDDPSTKVIVQEDTTMSGNHAFIYAYGKTIELIIPEGKTLTMNAQRPGAYKFPVAIYARGEKTRDVWITGRGTLNINYNGTAEAGSEAIGISAGKVVIGGEPLLSDTVDYGPTVNIKMNNAGSGPEGDAMTGILVGDLIVKDGAKLNIEVTGRALDPKTEGYSSDTGGRVNMAISATQMKLLNDASVDIISHANVMSDIRLWGGGEVLTVDTTGHLTILNEGNIQRYDPNIGTQATPALYKDYPTYNIYFSEKNATANLVRAEGGVSITSYSAPIDDWYDDYYIDGKEDAYNWAISCRGADPTLGQNMYRGNLRIGESVNVESNQWIRNWGSIEYIWAPQGVATVQQSKGLVMKWEAPEGNPQGSSIYYAKVLRPELNDIHVVPKGGSVGLVGGEDIAKGKFLYWYDALHPEGTENGTSWTDSIKTFTNIQQDMVLVPVRDPMKTGPTLSDVGYSVQWDDGVTKQTRYAYQDLTFEKVDNISTSGGYRVMLVPAQLPRYDVNTYAVKDLKGRPVMGLRNSRLYADKNAYGTDGAMNGSFLNIPTGSYRIAYYDDQTGKCFFSKPFTFNPPVAPPYISPITKIYDAHDGGTKTVTITAERNATIRYRQWDYAKNTWGGYNRYTEPFDVEVTSAQDVRIKAYAGPTIKDITSEVRYALRPTGVPEVKYGDTVLSTTDAYVPERYFYDSIELTVEAPEGYEVWYNNNQAPYEDSSGIHGIKVGEDGKVTLNYSGEFQFKLAKVVTVDGQEYRRLSHSVTKVKLVKLTELPTPRVTVKTKEGGQTLTPTGNTYTMTENVVTVTLESNGSWPLNATIAYDTNGNATPRLSKSYTVPFDVRGAGTLSVFTLAPKANGEYNYAHAAYTFKLAESLQTVPVSTYNGNCTSYYLNENGNWVSFPANESPLGYYLKVGTKVKIVPNTPTGQVFKKWEISNYDEYDIWGAYGAGDYHSPELIFSVPKLKKGNYGDLTLRIAATFGTAAEANISGQTLVGLDMSNKVGESISLWDTSKEMRTISCQWWVGNSAGTEANALPGAASFDPDKTYTVKVTIKANPGASFTTSAGVAIGHYGGHFTVPNGKITRTGKDTLTFTATPIRQINLTMPAPLTVGDPLPTAAQIGGLPAGVTVQELTWPGTSGNTVPEPVYDTVRAALTLKTDGTHPILVREYPYPTVNGEEYAYSRNGNSSSGNIVTNGSTVTVGGIDLPVKPKGVKVSGTITSYGSDSESITVQLIEAGHTEPAYEAIVFGNSAAYSFPTVPAGEYTLKVEKTGHAPFTKGITVGNSNVTENVTIYLIGDVNGDGAITADDLTALARHVAKISIITDTAALARCDVTKDGSVTADDLTMLARYVAKIISSFD